MHSGYKSRAGKRRSMHERARYGGRTHSLHAANPAKASVLNLKVSAGVDCLAGRAGGLAGWAVLFCLAVRRGSRGRLGMAVLS